ncbi:MAG: hypothetical protein ACM31C_30140 [Acidobacteriota bacterium]
MRATVLVMLAACKAGAPGVVDLTRSLEPVQRELDAHAGEARFLTLLSPT